MTRAARFSQSDRAYTVASLAQAWACSEGVIRKAIKDGSLGCFRLGTLIRIPAEEVRRFECRNIPSNDCEADSPSSGESAESEGAGGFRQPTALERNLRRAGFGRGATVHPGPWGGS